jgi:uncharacterized membrane protein
LTRVLSLSDGLFAIVLTLLVLDLKPDESVPGSLSYADLVALWPRLFAFFLTFLVGGSFWLEHHTDMDAIVNYDRSLLWLDLMFLLSISLLPFTTDVIGRELGPVSWALYALNMLFCGVLLTALWAYGTFAGFTRLTRADLRFGLGKHLIEPLVFAISIGVGLFAPSQAPLVILILLPLVSRLYARIAGRPSGEPSVSRRLPARICLYVGYSPVLLFAAWTVLLILSGSL